MNSTAQTREPGSRGCVILDRDGVINHDSPDYIRTPEQWRPIEGSVEAIAALGAAGFMPVVVSNQSGVGRGLLTAAILQRIHARMSEAVAVAGGRLGGIYHCPHTPEEGCGCRKPAPGLVRQMERELGYRAQGAPLIGDKESDLDLARRVGARPILVRTGYGATTLSKLDDPAVEVYSNLAEATAALIMEALT
ncbi:MAG: D-glycero-beta-D-manno-heptose 1,7-bisphosphate 7-phosphatase [Rhodospirillaceae bacterium]|nr:D-glycero-beta-D-manno-heptose 1,7-bisphosphate 7-phosphatase [Rhodospirillaceae bacterium]